MANCEELGDGGNNSRSHGSNKRKRGGGGLGMGVLEELEITGGVGSSFQDRWVSFTLVDTSTQPFLSTHPTHTHFLSIFSLIHCRHTHSINPYYSQ